MSASLGGYLQAWPWSTATDLPTLNGKVDEHGVQRLLPKRPAEVHVDQATVHGDHEVFLPVAVGEKPWETTWLVVEVSTPLQDI